MSENVHGKVLLAAFARRWEGDWCLIIYYIPVIDRHLPSKLNWRNSSMYKK